MTAGYTISGLRAWKEDSSASAVTYFRYDGTTPIIELSALGVVAATNTFGVNGLISRNISGVGSTFYTFDERGNVVQRLNSSGSATSSDLYSAFGTLITGGGDPFGFGAQSGGYTDSETGLVLSGQRYYSADVGRWMSRDPSGSGGGINLYSYCDNNPATYGTMSPMDVGILQPGMGIIGGGIFGGAAGGGAAAAAEAGGTILGGPIVVIVVVVVVVGVGAWALWNYYGNQPSEACRPVNGDRVDEGHGPSKPGQTTRSGDTSKAQEGWPGSKRAGGSHIGKGGL